MNYALDQFTLQGEETVIVQGSLSLYTYQNVGTDTTTVQGSNNNFSWVDIVTLASGAFSIQEHSFKYLRTTNSGLVYVNRGEGNNTNDSSGTVTTPNPGQGTGGGSYDFEVIDKDFSTSTGLTTVAPDFFAGAEGTHYVADGWNVTEQSSAGLPSISVHFTQGRMQVKLSPDMNVFYASPTKATAPLDLVLTPENSIPEEGVICSAMDLDVNGTMTRHAVVYSTDLSTLTHLAPNSSVFIEYVDGKYVMYSEANELIRSFGTGNANEYLYVASMGGQGANNITYKPMTAKGKSVKLPSNLKEGIYYRSLTDVNVGGFTFKANDYVQFYSNSTKAIINRLPTLPVPPTQHFRGSFGSPEVINVPNPVVGDYIFISQTRTLYMYNGYMWKPMAEAQKVSYTTDDIAETNNRKYLNHSTLVEHLDSVLNSFGVYIDLKTTFDSRVHEAVSNIQMQASGAFTKYFEEYVSVPTGIYSSRIKSVDTELAGVFDTTGNGMYALSIAKSPLTWVLPITSRYTNDSPEVNRMQVFLLNVLAISEAASSQLEFILYTHYPDPINTKFTITVDKPSNSNAVTGTFKSDQDTSVSFNLPELTELAFIIDRNKLYIRTSGGLTLMHTYYNNVPVFSAALNIDRGFRFKSFSVESIEYLS